MAEIENVIDNYKLANCLSQGRHSQVYEATDVSSSRVVALKILLAEAYRDKEHKATLKYEAKVAKSLDHPNIIRVVDGVVNRRLVRETSSLGG